MKITIHLDDELFYRAQQFAQAAGKTLDELIAEIIKQTLDQLKEQAADRDCGGNTL